MGVARISATLPGPPDARRGLLVATAAAAVSAIVTPSRASACTPLPDESVFASPANFADGRDEAIPANGALLFLLDCPNCTPCQAAEKKLNASLRDASGRPVLLRRFQQIFLRDRPTAHLVVVRPADRLIPGETYTAEVRALGQPLPTLYPFTAGPARDISDLSGSVSGGLATHRRERGTLFNCSLLSLANTCYPTWIGKTFGSEHEVLPLLSVQASAPAGASSQLLFRARGTSPVADSEWRAWRWGGAGDSFAYFERADSYCAEVQVETLLDPPAEFAGEICVPHGDLDAPSLRITDLQAELATCPVPPFEMQAEWCAGRGPPEPNCPTTGPVDPTKCTVSQYCGENPKAGPTARMASPDGPEPAPEPLCPSPRNPYQVGNVPGCAHGGPASVPASGVGLLALLVLLATACTRRRPIERDGAACHQRSASSEARIFTANASRSPSSA